MRFDDLLKHFKTPAQHKFYGRIHDDHVLDTSYQPKPISPNGAYFEVRLAEMFLSYKSEYGRSFVPFTVVASEFAYGGKRRTFPFFVGNELLWDIDSYVKGQDVTYRNTRVVGPVPYGGDDVALFVGLYRTQVDDFARKLLKVLCQMVAIFDVSRLSNYIDVADTLADGLYSLLNFKQLEYRTGDRGVFQDHGPMLFREGFFAYVNCDETAIKVDELWVQDGMLKIGASRNSLRSLKDHDYCLVQIQSSDTRNDYTSLTFHEKWKQARDRISHGDDALAHTLFIECCQQIADSPDLTPSHAESLIQVYQANYAKDVEFYSKLRGQAPQSTVTIYRGANSGNLTPQQKFIKTAQMALKGGMEEKAVQGLVELSENWEKVPHIEAREADLTDTFLNEQLASIQSFTTKREPNPKGLADALAIAAMTAS